MMVQARPQTFEMDATDGDGCWAIPWYEPNACDEPVAHVCAVEACAREVEIVVDSGADISVAPATSLTWVFRVPPQPLPCGMPKAVKSGSSEQECWTLPSQHRRREGDDQGKVRCCKHRVADPQPGALWVGAPP